MKKILLVLLCFTTYLSFATKGYETQYTLTDSGYKITFIINDWNLKTVNPDGEDFMTIDFNNAPVVQKKGFAEVPFMSASVQLPAQKNVTLRVVATEYTDVQLDFPLQPSRGVIYRNQDPKSIPYRIAQESLVDDFYPESLSYLENPFIVRDVRGTTVRVFPFRYKANSKILRVYTKVEVLLVINNEPAKNPLLREPRNHGKEDQGLYRSMFLNYEMPRASANLDVAEYGDMLVLTPPAYESTIDPYIQWKREKGYQVTKQVVTAGANVSTIIQNAYNNNPNLMYVQLVGDWADIKSNTIYSDGSNAPIDPNMGCVSGSDNYPDIAIGRFSCSNTSDLLVQINKAIKYEKEPNMEEGWRETFIGIASDEGPGDDSEYDYQHIQRIYSQRLSGFTYQTHQQNYDPNASSATLATHVNSGASTIAYCGHGSSSAFVTTYYGNSQVNNSTNGDKLPFIVSVACVNGAFHGSSVCFAESWLRKANGGAVVTWMSTINQPWDPPQRGQDYFYDILIGGFNYDAYSGQSGYNTNEQRTHWGSITVNSTNLMLAESSYDGDLETVKTWTTFGDASLQLRTKKPDNLLLSNTVVPVGAPFAGTATVNGTPQENVLICISQNGNYYSGLSDANGNYSINHALTPGNVLLVGTSFNTTTIYQQTTCTGDVCETVENLSAQVNLNEVTLSWTAPAEDSITGYNIYRDGNLIATVNTTSFYENNLLNGTYNYCVAVLYNNEECYMTTCTSVEASDGINHDCPEIDNLSLMANSNQVTVQWTAPQNAQTIFEDVESHNAFTINSQGTIRWNYIDGDQKNTFSIANYSFTNNGQKMAYIVFDPSQVMPTSGSTPLSQGEGFPAHSGSKFFASFGATTPPNNDWLISPELNYTGDITFSFYARSGHKAEYVESFRVGYSLSGNTQTDFTILESVSSVPLSWTLYNYTIPAGAKYVAINCNSNDKYYLCVDDITISENNPAAVAYYEVYCDGNSIGTTTETNYVHQEGSFGNHTYCVEAHYASGCVAYPVCEEVTITETTYTISANASNGGTISPSGVVGVTNHGNKTFTITPNNGYRIRDVRVNQVSQGSIASYTFTDVTENHTIYAEFEQTPSEISDFDIQNVKIFPNPVNDELFIEAPGIDKVSIINMLGQVVFSQNELSDKVTINMSSFHSGVYFVRLQKGSDIITRKVIKK